MQNFLFASCTVKRIKKLCMVSGTTPEEPYFFPRVSLRGMGRRGRVRVLTGGLPTISIRVS